ncbi:histidine phosphatase family protein [Peribacillus cavernae]|uniref:phosphoglycerate mutase (2,3-diphosphoglycerate-dependent) n=1 Tax=Peribacillus cavernae TaxID=1674310 RepID=A0A433HFB1_9BACI|nr:histidine phosphatase family protein [Peribacillus cavernae]MDQ0221279.1 putative phosphoglycerate mutase [Peribacillus cavernae]RUQ26983.1 histidine phosphatase family protein [Peribacillus cavernae]
MLTIYLTRHGQTEWNLEGRLQGWGNGELTEEGINDALALGRRLKDVPIDTIYSSTSKRAYHTAELIIGSRDIPIFQDESLREMGFGDWEGKIRTEIGKEYEQEYKAFWETPHLYNRNSGELFAHVIERVVTAFNHIVEKHPSGTVLVVSHSITLRILIAYIKNLPLEKLFTQHSLGNTSLTKIVVTEKHPEIIFEGNMSHTIK